MIDEYEDIQDEVDSMSEEEVFKALKITGVRVYVTCELAEDNHFQIQITKTETRAVLKKLFITEDRVFAWYSKKTNALFLGL